MTEAERKTLIALTERFVELSRTMSWFVHELGDCIQALDALAAHTNNKEAHTK